MRDDAGRLLKAVHFAAQKHRDQRRKDRNGTPYINHPIAVAETLCAHGVTSVETLAAALLHDVLEDTETAPGDLASAFGAGVLAVVREVTDDKSLPKQMRKQLQIDCALQLSTPARLVRLADKICNLRDLIEAPPENWPLVRRQDYVAWCEAVVAPIRGTHAGLESQFDALLQAARERYDMTRSVRG